MGGKVDPTTKEFVHDDEEKTWINVINQHGLNTALSSRQNGWKNEGNGF